MTAMAATTIRPAISAYSSTSPPVSSFINLTKSFFMTFSSNRIGVGPLPATCRCRAPRPALTGSSHQFIGDHKTPLNFIAQILHDLPLRPPLTRVPIITAIPLPLHTERPRRLGQRGRVVGRFQQFGVQEHLPFRL